MTKMAEKPPFDPFTTKSNYLPDHRWSWIVMLASFGSQFIVIGYQRSFGLLFVAFHEKYGYSSGLLSIVNGTQSLTYSFSTMVVMNYILKKMSIRASCLLGATIQAAGIVTCYFYHNMAALIVCQGFLFGLGHAFLYCPTILIVSQYFEKHRSVAVAISQSGSSLGGIAFPYISRLLLDHFGLEGGLLLLGAIILNQCIFYAMFQPINRDLVVPKPAQNGECLSKLENGTCKNECKTCQLPNIVVDEGTTACSALLLSKSQEIKSQAKCNIDVLNNNQFKISRFNGLSSSQLIVSPSVINAESNQGCEPRLFSSHHALGIKDNLSQSLSKKSKQYLASKEALSESLSKKSKEYLSILGGSTMGLNTSIADLMETRSHETLEDGDNTRYQKYKEKTDENANVSTTLEAVDDCLLERASLSDNEKQSCFPEVVRLPNFWVVAVFIIGGIISAGCPALFIPPLAREKGLTNEDATFFLTISATTDFIGRIIAGVVLHFKLVNSATLAIVPLALSALFFNLTPVLQEFYSVMTLTLQYGLSSSMYWTLWNLVIIDALGLENLGPAMGFYAVINGLTTSASFPLAGWLHDVTGSYNSSFHYFGAMSLVSVLALLVFIFSKHRSRCLSS